MNQVNDSGCVSTLFCYRSPTIWKAWNLGNFSFEPTPIIQTSVRRSDTLCLVNGAVNAWLDHSGFIHWWRHVVCRDPVRSLHELHASCEYLYHECQHCSMLQLGYGVHVGLDCTIFMHVCVLCCHRARGRVESSAAAGIFSRCLTATDDQQTTSAYSVVVVTVGCLGRYATGVLPYFVSVVYSYEFKMQSVFWFRFRFPGSTMRCSAAAHRSRKTSKSTQI